MEDFTPAECDGKCQICPHDDKCDHIRLTKSQVNCISAFACIVFFLAITYMAIILIRYWK